MASQIEYRIPHPEHGYEPVVLIEFTRDDLERLVHLYPPEDGFTVDVRKAMLFLDGLDTGRPRD